MLNLKTNVRNHLPISHSKQQIRDVFPEIPISVTYKRNKNLRDLLSPSQFPESTEQSKCSIKEFNKICEI